MSALPSESWLWEQALQMLEQAERLRRQFCVPQQPPGRPPAWEPPVDIFETEEAIWIVIALPGAAPESVEIAVAGTELVVAAHRALPASCRRARVHRLEIPHGRFERRLPLPPGSYELARRELANGCLTLQLRRLD
ncbi:MAG: heat-shock protein [Planctomycetota bacterium]|nr:MAG: heat-shock protein [Planctomycetota bacterium]